MRLADLEEFARRVGREIRDLRAAVDELGGRLERLEAAARDGRGGRHLRTRVAPDGSLSCLDCGAESADEDLLGEVGCPWASR